MKRALAAALLACFLPLFASAAICYGTYDTNPNENAGEAMNTAIGGGFTNVFAAKFVPTITCTITQVQNRMHAAAGNPTDGITIKLHSDSSGSPGTVLQTVTFDDSGLTGTYSTTTQAITGTTLTAGVTYWMSYARAGAGSNVNYAELGGVFGTGTDKSSIDYGTWGAQSAQMTIEIDGTTAAVATPLMQTFTASWWW